MQNPHEYDDQGWIRGSNEITAAIQTFWDAGATLDDIEEAVYNAIEEATGRAAAVTIIPGAVREARPAKPKQKKRGVIL